MSTFNQHGGNLDAIHRHYHIPKESIIDFSSNVNPLGVPQSAKDAIVANTHMLSVYPDASYQNLRQSIATYTNTSPDHVVVGNGSTELISLFIKTTLGASLKHQKAVILSPAYSEYEKEVTSLGIEALLFPLQKAHNFHVNIPNLLATLDGSVSIFVVCNPNNPTGTAINNQQMTTILNHCAQKNIWVMVDETYAEFASDPFISATKLIEKHLNLFIVRGTSKFFAVPGLRLGYGLCANTAFVHTMNQHKDPWSVNTLAEIAGIAMFADTPFMAKTTDLITTQRQLMEDTLSTWSNIVCYHSQANFILIELLEQCPNDSATIFSTLIQQRLLIRDCANFSHLDHRFIRFCILLPHQNQMLLQALKPLVENTH